MNTFPRRFILVVLTLILAATHTLTAQTFRGGIAGGVQDSTGAAVSNASITLTDPDTGTRREMKSTSSGDYSFQDLPLGSYSIEVTGVGFQLTRIDKIVVRPGQVYSLDIKLSVASSTQQVEVNAAALSLDTVSSTNNNVINEKAVSEIPLNGRDFTQLIKITPGYNGAGSLNGTRTNQNNYQIDGADDNDIWQNASAANQGGVGSIAGVTLPIDSIDQFTVQSQGNAEAGRNGGGLISLAIKSGTNTIHGTAYYFNRNEFFAAKTPFLLTAQRKPKLRNEQFGGSIGGPIFRDKLFYFANYEEQRYLIQNSSTATEPTAAYITAATSLLAAHNIPVNPLSTSLLALYPFANKPVGPAASGNYLDTRPQKGYSYNTIAKLDYNMTPRQTISLRGFIGTGRQYAAVGTNVFDYFQVAPDITQNFSATHNWAITDHVSNQLLAAVGIFNQTFNDANHSYNLPALGLADGVTDPSLYGAPTISITGFDTTGQTQPIGRKDYTGHLTDTATYVVGKHQYRFGGEFRRNYMDLQYQRNVRGTFNFTGSATAPGNITLPAGQTSYSADSSFGGSDVRALADYLAGFVASSSFVQGYLRRSIYQNTYSAFVQDQFQARNNLTLNYGLRYDFNAPFHSPGVLSDFRPGAVGADNYGLQIVNSGPLGSIYPNNFSNFGPRFGLSFQAAQKLVLRATYGIYFDAINFNGFFDNRPGNGAAAGVQANPTGATPVLSVSRPYYQWQTGVNPFGGATAAAAIGLASVSPNFRTAYVENFNLNTEYQINRSNLLQIGYVGSLGRRLFRLTDINQARTSPTGLSTTADIQSRRPYYANTSFANAQKVAAINEVQSAGSSNYHSLQVSLRTSGFHGLTSQASYTLGHALDLISGTRGFSAQDFNNLSAEYGNADFDVRHTFNGYIVYEAPQIGHFLPSLTKGWQGNAFVTAFTGTPFSIKTGTDNSRTGENQDRVNQVGDPQAGVNRALFTPTAGQPYVPWFTSAAFVANPVNTFGTSARNNYRGPAFVTVDASLVKNTRIREGVSLQIRAELFNISNRTNLANPTATLSSSSFGRSTTTRNNGSAPGIGPGEPFNAQFAGKIIF